MLTFWCLLRSSFQAFVDHATQGSSQEHPYLDFISMLAERANRIPLKENWVVQRRLSGFHKLTLENLPLPEVIDD